MAEFVNWWCRQRHACLPHRFPKTSSDSCTYTASTLPWHYSGTLKTENESVIRDDRVAGTTQGKWGQTFQGHMTVKVLTATEGTVAGRLDSLSNPVVSDPTPTPLISVAKERNYIVALLGGQNAPFTDNEILLRSKS